MAMALIILFAILKSSWPILPSFIVVMCQVAELDCGALFDPSLPDHYRVKIM